MGMVSVFGALFHKKGRMPIEVSGQNVDAHNERQEILNVQPAGEYIFLQELLLCDEAHAAEIAEVFEEVTRKKLENAELVPTEKKSKLLKVDTSDKTYYLQVSSINELDKICEDSENGEVIYQIIY